MNNQIAILIFDEQSFFYLAKNESIGRNFHMHVIIINKIIIIYITVFKN